MEHNLLKRKSLRPNLLLITLLLLAVSATMRAAERVIGYCPNEISSNVKPIGVSGSETYLQAAVKFPSSVMSAMKGNQITKIRIGIGSGMTSVYVWVRVGSLSSKAVVLQKVSDVVEGWNEVTLNTPYNIDGSEIYVGYMGKQPADNLCVWLDGQENKNATYISDGTWEDYYGQGWGALCIQAVVSGDNFLDDDVAAETITLDSAYYRTGSKAKADLSFVNQGLNTAENLSYSWQIDNQEPIVGSLSSALASSERATASAEFDLAGLSEGQHVLRAYINRSETSTDEEASNDTVSTPLLVYSTTYKHNILLEQFTTIPCSNCPYGDRVLEYATGGRDDIAWVAHHVGYRTDELTLSTSSNYMNFGVRGAPYAMLDRTVVESGGSAPAFSIGYSSAVSGGNRVKGYFEDLLSAPTFAKVDVSCDYDEGTRELKVTAKGERNGIFEALQSDVCLTMFVTEDNVTAKVAQAGTTDDYTHDHVLRAVLTSTFGDGVTWSGNSFESTKSVTLEESWKPADVTAIAFISKPYVSSNPSNAQVINTGMAKIPGLTGIKAVNMDDCAVRFSDGRLVVNGQYDSVSVYKADGTQVNPMNVQRGMYIVKLRKDGKVITKKVMF